MWNSKSQTGDMSQVRFLSSWWTLTMPAPLGLLQKYAWVLFACAERGSWMIMVSFRLQKHHESQPAGRTERKLVVSSQLLPVISRWKQLKDQLSSRPWGKRLGACLVARLIHFHTASLDGRCKCCEWIHWLTWIHIMSMYPYACVFEYVFEIMCIRMPVGAYAGTHVCICMCYAHMYVCLSVDLYVAMQCKVMWCDLVQCNVGVM